MRNKLLSMTLSMIVIGLLFTGCAKRVDSPALIPEESVETPIETPIETPVETPVEAPVEEPEEIEEEKVEPVITTEKVTEEVKIPFKTVKKNDESLEKGKKVISQKGVEGVEIATYEVTYTDGVETGRKEVGREVTKKVVEEVVKVGVKVAASSIVPTTDTITIPDGKGMTLEAYVNEIIKIDAISDKGFEMNATSQYSNTVEKGIIIVVKTDINNYKPGSVIEVVESLGPDRTIAEKPESFEPYEEKLDNVPPLMIQYKYSFSSSLENEILKELNAYRAEHGLNPVTMDTTLQKAARWKSNAQLQHNYFGHRDTKYGHTVDVIDYHMDGIDSSIYHSLSENLHYTTSLSTSAKRIVTAWKNSPDHNENMLGDWWNVIGIGVVKSETSGSAFHNTGAVISTQVFGTR